MIKIAICDDENVFGKKLEKIILQFFKKRQEKCELDIFQSGITFLEKGEELAEYHIIFLDISMGKINGMEIARKLRKFCKKSYIIFVTAYIEFSSEGYQVEALRYILKSNPLLREAINESLEAVLEKMNYLQRIREYFFREGKRKISSKQIVYIETQGHYLLFHVINQGKEKFHYRESMSNMENILKKENFLRIHQGYLVNAEYIKKLLNYNAYLVTDEVLPVAKLRYGKIKKIFAEMKGKI